MDIDLTTLTDEQLELHRLDVVNEQIRRQEIDTTPAQVDNLIQRYIDHGGDKTKIKDPSTYEKTPKPPKPPKDETPTEDPGEATTP